MSKFCEFVKDSTFMVSDLQVVEVVFESTLEMFQVPQCTNCARKFRDARIMSEVQRVDWDLLTKYIHIYRALVKKLSLDK